MPGKQKITTFLWFDANAEQAANGGPQFKFTEAISLVVNCETQKEVDDIARLEQAYRG